MRNRYRISLAGAVCLAVATAASAQDHAFVQGFGGIRLSSGPLDTAAGLASPNLLSSGSFGAVAGADLTPNIQAVGEFGRMGNVLPGTMQSILSYSPYDVRVSALYGEGGVRLTTGTGAGVRPYVETSAGVARLRTGVDGLRGADPYINAALGFMTTTRPLATVGGGVVFQGGRVVVDAGYRFSRIFANGSLAGLFSAGDIDANQLRVGFGVRF
jgi:hypothetical protein